MVPFSGSSVVSLSLRDSPKSISFSVKCSSSTKLTLRSTHGSLREAGRRRVSRGAGSRVRFDVAVHHGRLEAVQVRQRARRVLAEFLSKTRANSEIGNDSTPVALKPTSHQHGANANVASGHRRGLKHHHRRRRQRHGQACTTKCTIRLLLSLDHLGCKGDRELRTTAQVSLGKLEYALHALLGLACNRRGTNHKTQSAI